MFFSQISYFFTAPRVGLVIAVGMPDEAVHRREDRRDCVPVVSKVKEIVNVLRKNDV